MNKQEWFSKKVSKVPPAIMAEVELSAEIITRIDKILKVKGMTQRDDRDTEGLEPGRYQS